MKKNPNTPEFWDKQLITLSRIPGEDYITKDRISNIARIIPNENIKLLDVGAGYGFLESDLEDKENIKLYCIDISFKGIIKLKRRYVGEFIVGSSKELPFQKDTFNYICLLEVLEHLYYEEGKYTLLEVHRLLKPSGHLIVTVPLYDRVIRVHPSRHLRMYTPAKIITEIESAGFKVTYTKSLFAFKRNYLLKNFINKLFNIKKKPNNIIILARKK